MSRQKNNAYFVTGTDTGVGKTWSVIALMQALQKAGLTTCGMKPIASGGMVEGGLLISGDAKLLIERASISLPYKLVNPVCFKSPASPNIASMLEHKPVDTQRIIRAYEEILRQVDRLIVEGVGGWKTPCINTAGMAVLIREMQLPVILVVGLRLGCINHALLTRESIIADGFELAGWIANGIDPDYQYINQTLECLHSCIDSPFLGHIPYQAQRAPNMLAGFIRLPALM